MHWMTNSSLLMVLKFNWCHIFESQYYFNQCRIFKPWHQLYVMVWEPQHSNLCYFTKNKITAMLFHLFILFCANCQLPNLSEFLYADVCMEIDAHLLEVFGFKLRNLPTKYFGVQKFLFCVSPFFIVHYIQKMV